MLVRLTSSTSGEMIMFAEHTRVLFGWIGKKCTARGIFTKEELPGAIIRLRHGLDEEKRAIRLNGEKQRGENMDGADDEKTGENKERHPGEPVTPGQRAQPLIRLMERTLKEEGNILWDAPGDF